MAVVIKSKLLLQREEIEAMDSVAKVQMRKSSLNAEKWNKLAFSEIMRLCDVRVQELKSKG